MNRTKPNPDPALLSNLIGGDKKAYEGIFLKYYSTLCAYARQFVSEGTAENIVQDLMLWLWENRRMLPRDMKISAYLFRAVRNRCIVSINHRDMQRRVFGTIREEIISQIKNYDFPVIEEMKSDIDKAIEELPDTYREAFVITRFHKKTYTYIGK
ncbi:MAG: sigma-70 family RNA polymerase sigma factor, partial [Alistipes sp.]|nr:sigma-70 family RNA polymerase sigma factor [Alistipes sp.]